MENAALEHFRAKWTPVRVKKMRRDKKLEQFSDSAKRGTALEARPACRMETS
jgi:hypothetical protein